VVLQEIRTRINILQSQDNQIVDEANSIFEVHKKEMEKLSKRILDNANQIISVKGTSIGIQRSLKDMNTKIEQVNKVLESIKTSLKEVPSKKDLKDHTKKDKTPLPIMSELSRKI